MRVACQIVLTDEERKTLQRWSRGRRWPARLVMRARTVLLAADGRSDREIAAEEGTDRLTAGRWRRRFAQKRLAGIEKDAPRIATWMPSHRHQGWIKFLKQSDEQTPAELDLHLVGGMPGFLVDQAAHGPL